MIEFIFENIDTIILTYNTISKEVTIKLFKLVSSYSYV